MTEKLSTSQLQELRDLANYQLLTAEQMAVDVPIVHPHHITTLRAEIEERQEARQLWPGRRQSRVLARILRKWAWD